MNSHLDALVFICLALLFTSTGLSVLVLYLLRKHEKSICPICQRNKRSNKYALALNDVYDEIPNDVLAAIAVSALTCAGDQLDSAKQYIAEEWFELHRHGIVPQEPPRSVTKFLSVNSGDAS